MGDDNQGSRGAGGSAPCPTCGGSVAAPALTDWDGNDYSHALPMQLLGSIDVSLARWADGSGHAVVEPGTGMPLVTGRTAQKTWDAAQDIAAQLGRRRVQAVIQSGLASPISTKSSNVAETGVSGWNVPAQAAGEAAADSLYDRAMEGLSPWERNSNYAPEDDRFYLRYAGELDGPGDKRLFAGNGGGPRRIVDVSHYSDPISHGEGEASGRSRNAGDATPDVKTQAMKAIVSAGRARGLSSDEIALALATARLESGFNPDAAARGKQRSRSGTDHRSNCQGLGISSTGPLETAAASRGAG